MLERWLERSGFLGELLCTGGACLQLQDPGGVHSSFSVLLDFTLCAMSPKLFLTSHQDEIKSDQDIRLINNELLSWEF